MSRWQIIGGEPGQEAASAQPRAPGPGFNPFYAEDGATQIGWFNPETGVGVPMGGDVDLKAGDTNARPVRAAPAAPSSRPPLPRIPPALGRMVREIPARLRRDQDRVRAAPADARIPRPPGPPPELPRSLVQPPSTRKDLPFNTRVYNRYAPTVKAINDGITYIAGPHLGKSLANLTDMLRFTGAGDAEAYLTEAKNLRDTLSKWKPGKSGGVNVANQLPLSAAALVGMIMPAVPAKGAVQLGKLGKAGKTAKRTAKARATAARPGPDTALVYQHAEGVAGAGTNHLPGLLKAPYKTQAAFTSRVSKAFQDPQGMDIINKNIGLRPIATRQAQGAFQASPQHPIEYNATYVSGSEVPLVGGNHLSRADEQRLRTAATLRASMTGQFAVPYNGLVPIKGGIDVIVPRGKKLSRNEMKRFVDKYGFKNVVAADTGKGVNVLNSGKPYTSDQFKDIGGILGGEAHAARNVTNPAMNYPDLQAELLRAPGSRRVTQRVMDELRKLSANDFKGLDGWEIRAAAADIHKTYTRQAKTGDPVRKDLMNYLSIVRDKGLAGLRAALDAKEFLPALAAIGLAPQLYRMSRGAEDEQYD